MDNKEKLNMSLKIEKVHNRNTIIKFDDYPEFKPDFSPIEMFWLGIFGGNYFSRNHYDNVNLKKNYEYSKFKNEVLDDNDLHFLFSVKATSNNYNINKNLFGVKCGSTLEQWLGRNWIFECDPFGWVEWYINFYYGRRNKCDKKQIKRWVSFKARHSGMLLAKCKPEEIEKCLKTRQNLLQWGIDSTKL